MPPKKKKTALTFKVEGLRPAKSDIQRTRILQGALQLLAKGDTVTLEAVARACNCRRSHVAYYYGQAPDLLWNAIKYALSFGQEYAVHEILLASSPAERLVAFLNANLHWFENHPTHAAAYAQLNYLALCQPRYAQFERSLAEMAEARLAAILIEYTGAKKEAQRQRCATVARVLRQYLVGAIARFLILTPIERIEERAAMAEAVLQIAKQANDAA